MERKSPLASLPSELVDTVGILSCCIPLPVAYPGLHCPLGGPLHKPNRDTDTHCLGCSTAHLLCKCQVIYQDGCHVTALEAASRQRAGNEKKETVFVLLLYALVSMIAI